MPLMNIIIVLVVAGVLLWAINKYIPMASSIKNILNIVVVLVIVVWLLQVFGIIGSMSNIRID
jgi:small-conductance mechanosensitive channel